MPTIKELLSQVAEAQKKQGKLLTEIDICLRGPKYDESNGGLVAEVHHNTKSLRDIKKKQNRIITWGIAIFGLINAAGVITVIIDFLRRSSS